MPKMRKKSDLPGKICASCGRPFTWRKSWAQVLGASLGRKWGTRCAIVPTNAGLSALEDRFQLVERGFPEFRRTKGYRPGFGFLGGKGQRLD